MAQILDGKVVRDKIADSLKSEISKLDQKPQLVIFQVGDLPESNAYVGQKTKFGQKIGAIVKHKRLPEKISQPELIGQIEVDNNRPDVHGIIVQLPIPNRLDKNAVIEAINPQKDVDGQTSKNIKLLFEGLSGFVPATTKGILTLLDWYKIPVSGKHIVVVGRSSLVGKPTALAFLNRDATVTVCHSKTKNLATITKTADILISAVGKINLITKNHVGKNQVVIDVGINAADKKLKGDVNFGEVKKIVGAISPVPGGAGPMTVASLFQNLLDACTRK